MHIWGVSRYSVPTIHPQAARVGKQNQHHLGCVLERFFKECNTQQKVFPSTRIRSSWQSFLRVDDNKTELFSLLAQRAVTLPIEEGKELYSTYGDCPYIRKQT